MKKEDTSTPNQWYLFCTEAISSTLSSVKDGCARCYDLNNQHLYTLFPQCYCAEYYVPPMQEDKEAEIKKTRQNRDIKSTSVSSVPAIYRGQKIAKGSVDKVCTHMFNSKSSIII